MPRAYTGSMQEPLDLEHRSNYATARCAENPEALAKLAIAKLERHLLSTHGIVVPMGIELEFSCQYPDRLKKQRRRSGENPYGLDKVENDYVPRYKRKTIHGKQFYRHSPSVASMYNESGYLVAPQLDKNEIVFSHLGAFGPSDKPRLHNLAQAVHHEWSKFIGERFPCPTTSRFNPSLLKYPFPLGYFENATFTPYVSGHDSDGDPEGHTHGMHVNISFTHYGVPLLPNVDSNEISVLCGVYGEIYSNLINQTLWVLAPSPSSYERWKEREVDIPIWEIKNKVGRIENKLPGADCNPYYAVLMSLAATTILFDTYGAETVTLFAHSNLDADDEKLWRSLCRKHPELFQMPDSLVEAEAAFRSETILRNLLNGVEPRLGDRLHLALLQTPPGKEPSAYRERRSDLTRS